MKHLIRKTISVFSAAAMLCANMPRVSADEIPALSDPDWIAFAEEKTAQYDTPGLTVSAVCGADTGYRSFGYAEDGVPVTEDTVFSIASCSKAFTALSILILQEDGKLSVDDRVSDYLGWWHVTWQGAPQDTTIRQLLNHCSGIPNSTFSHYSEAVDRNEKVAYLAKGLGLGYEPDTAFEYSNLGYVVLAEITETVSGMPFADYVKQEIFDPIGMTHSGILIPAV
ncbi:MAG TPA: serine hydrolase, partial [Ruminococcus sp.]|nr:serine hydrolase [Ruminococcus sp.]